MDEPFVVPRMSALPSLNHRGRFPASSASPPGSCVTRHLDRQPARKLDRILDACPGLTMTATSPMSSAPSPANAEFRDPHSLDDTSPRPGTTAGPGFRRIPPERPGHSRQRPHLALELWRRRRPGHTHQADQTPVIRPRIIRTVADPRPHAATVKSRLSRTIGNSPATFSRGSAQWSTRATTGPASTSRPTR